LDSGRHGGLGAAVFKHQAVLIFHFEASTQTLVAHGSAGRQPLWLGDVVGPPIRPSAHLVHTPARSLGHCGLVVQRQLCAARLALAAVDGVVPTPLAPASSLAVLCVGLCVYPDAG